MSSYGVVNMRPIPRAETCLGHRSVRLVTFWRFVFFLKSAVCCRLEEAAGREFEGPGASGRERSRPSSPSR